MPAIVVLSVVSFDMSTVHVLLKFLLIDDFFLKL